MPAPQQSADLWTRAYDWSLCALAFVLPLFFNTQSISLVVLSVCGLAIMLRRNARIVWRTQGVLWLAYFLVYSLSALCSADKAAALNDWSRKLGMPLMAIFIGLMPQISARQLRRALASYILGNLLSLLWCAGYVLWATTPVTRAAFFNDELVHGLEYNAAYTSLHVIIALAALLLGERHLPQSILQPRIRWATTAMLWGFLLFLGSKLLVALGLLLWIGAAAQQYRKGGWRWRPAIRPAVAFAGVAACFLLVSGSLLAARYDALRAGVPPAGSSAPVQESPIGEADNLTKRRVAWKAAWLAFRAAGNWGLGVGAGDFQQEMTAIITRPDFTFAHYTDFTQLAGMNAHNMYLQSLVAAGLPALLLLLAIAGWGLRSAIRVRSALAIAFWITAGLFLAQESALQTQAGLFPICFVSLLLTNALGTRKILAT